MALQQYMEKAVGVLEKYGLTSPQEEDSQLAMTLEKVAHVDQARVLAIANTIKYIGTFSQLVRDNVNDMNVSTRYADITENFDSIRDDAKTLLAQLDDGKIDLGEKVQNWWMKIARGTIKGRFDDIQELYTDVNADVKKQLQNEDEIMDAYIDFRFALKETEALAFEVQATHKAMLEEKQNAFSEAQSAVENYQGENASEKSRLELARDQAQTAYQDEEKTEQLIKDVAENLSMSYHVGETLIAKLRQTHGLKERVFQKGVAFMATNEQVFTLLSASYTSNLGLHEASETQEALEAGVNNALEDVAEISHDIERRALKAGYGSTYNPASVQKLVDSIVSFQVESAELIKEYRAESEASAKEVARIVEEGKTRARNAQFKFLKKAA